MDKLKLSLVLLVSLFLFYVITSAGVVYFMEQPFHPSIVYDLWNASLRSGQGAPQELKLITLAGLLVIASSIILNPYMTRTKAYGDAQWANKHDLKKMELFSKTGFILGKWKGKFLRTKEYLSVIFIAPPNSLKSVGLMIPNLLSCGDSILAYDVKYDLFNKTSKRRSEFSKVFRFSPGDKDSAKFNPLAKEIIGSDWDEIIGAVESLATIIYPDVKTGDSHWIMGARNVFIFFALIEISEKKETSIPLVRERALESAGFIEEDEDNDVIIQGTKGWLMNYLDLNEDDMDKYLLLLGNDLIGRPDKEFGSVVSTFSTGLAGFADSRCSEAFSSCDFDPSMFRKERVSLYLCVKNKDTKRFSIPLRIILETFADHFLSNEPKKEECGITYFLDEFPRLGKMDVIVDAPALQRSNRVRSIFCCQDEAQITEIYGREKVSTFKSSCAFHIHVPQNTDALNKAISESSGYYTAKKKSYSVSKSNSTSHSEEKRLLILPQDVGSMPTGEMILHTQGFRNRPAKARLPLFFENRKMKKMIGSIESEVKDSSEQEA